MQKQDHHHSEVSFNSAFTTLDDEIITLNIGGFKYKTRWRTLEKYPNTRLGKLKLACLNEFELKEICDGYNLYKNEFFFDHSPSYFNLILNFYRINKIHLDDSICPLEFEKELFYWNLDTSIIDTCCKIRFVKKKDLITDEINKDESLYNDLLKEMNINSSLQAKFFKEKISDLFEKPNSSFYAKIIYITSIFFILLSTVCLIVSSEFSHYENSINNNQINRTNLIDKRAENIIYGLNIIEAICIIWFTFEFLIRLWSCNNKEKFFKNVQNIIDIICIIPFYFGLFIQTNYRYNDFRQFFQMLRILRVLKLGRHSTSIRSLGYTLRRSYNELIILLLSLSINVLLFSSITYYAEKDDQDTKFTSITSSFWWALITMTTVGYGDMYPNTTLGKIFGSVCAIFGILTIAMPMAIISKNFEDFYQLNEQKKKLKLLIEKSKHKNSSNNIEIEQTEFLYKTIENV